MLAIDVGNTQITTGLFAGTTLREVYRVPTQTCLESLSFFEHLPEVCSQIHEGTVISSVREAVTGVIVREIEDRAGTQPLFVDVSTPMGIEVRYQTKETLGIDRLICAAAAYPLYRKQGKAMVVIDMGTATTIDYLTEDGAFIGGMITPGLKSSYQGLLAGAPQLPLLDDLMTQIIIGGSTAECIRSGLTIGHAAMIRGVVEMMAQAKGTDPVVVLTGGLLRLVSGMLPRDYIIDAELILKGLATIFTLQNKNKC